jgi:phenylacetate-CoA ligase
MDLYKPVLKHLIMPLWAKWERSPYLKHLKYLDKSQYFPPNKIKEIQWEKIKKLLVHAHENSKYYKELFAENNILPEKINSYEDYKNIPVLTKDDVRQNLDKILAPNYDKYIPFLTSGSTGIPLKGYRNKECSEYKRACGRRSELWSGYDLGERIYCLYGEPEKELTGLTKLKATFRRKYLYRTEILNLLKLSDKSMFKFAEKMRKKPPSLLWGHAHGLYQLALFLEKNKITDIQPKGMYSAGMVLHNWERKKIEEVFKCKIQDRYGGEELGLIATECKKQEGLHINTDSHFVEFLDKDGNHVAAGERGVIVVTDLTNYVMPFIRYRLEDVGTYSTDLCSCGCTQPLIKKLEGRVADFLITPEKELVSGISLTDHFAGHIPGVAQIQIIQNKIDKLELKIVKNNDYGEKTKEQVSKLIEDFFGKKMQFVIDLVDSISKESSGKYRFTICNINNDQL